MRFSHPLVQGVLLKRYKRFLADIDLGRGDPVTVYCANPGSMMGLLNPGNEVWLSKVPSPKEGKLLYHWEIVKADGVFVGVNTARPNELVAEALSLKKIPEFSEYPSFRREVPYGNNSRVDFVLEGEGLPPYYVEVKNVHLMRGGEVQFPDSVTKRGAKHLLDLATIKAQGMRAALLYVVQRNDSDIFSLAQDIDPQYAKSAQEAQSQGVDTLCYACDVTPEEITIKRRLTMMDK